MAQKIKVRYDKNLNKYHIDYHKLVDPVPFRYKTIKDLNHNNDLAFLIETHLGSITKPDQLTYTKIAEGLFAKHKLRYQVRPLEVANSKNIFGMFPSGKKTVTHFALTFIVPSKAFTQEMFNDFLCEYDVQIGYKMLKSQDTFFDDLQKGYISDVFNPEYFEESFYDSRVFDKFLATEDISTLEA